ncbi:MAG: zinc-ribbon domain-containing protein [Chloroflexia bacterium]
MSICPNCGARNPRENTVCRSCGAVLGGEPEPAVVEEAPQPEGEAQEAEVVSERAVAEEEESEESPGMTCIRCQAPIAPGEALVIPGRVRGQPAALCPRCVSELEARFAAETEGIRMGRAALFGAAAAIVGAVIWYLVYRYSGTDLTLLAFLGGWGIAEAVRFGAGKKRGRKLQWLALGLTAAMILGAEYAILGRLNPADFFSAFWAQTAGSLFTLILYALGLFQAYSTPAPRRLIGTRR